MKKLFFIITMLAVFCVSAVLSQSSDWTKSLDIGVTLSQSESRSGATSGQSENSSLSYGILVNGELTKDNDRANWKNTLKLEYSRSRNKIAGVTGDWSEDIDKLTIDSMYRWKIYPKFNPYAALNIQTAVLDSGSDAWKAFRPLQLRESAGASSPLIDEKNQRLVARAGFFHEHLVNDPDDKDSLSGIELVFDYRNQFKEDMLFLSKLGFYSSLNKTEDITDSSKKTTKVKMEWDNTLLVKISNYLNMNLTFNILNLDISNDDVKYEWEQKLNLAFNYKIF